LYASIPYTRVALLSASNSIKLRNTIHGAKVASLGPVRASLLKKGMVYSPSFGEMTFTVPLFDEFMRRTMSLD
jgi:hypothetical protein